MRLPAAIESALKQRQAEREKRETWQKLLQTNRQLRELSGHLQNIREEERTRIAREIHDQLGQQLTVMKMDISWLNKKTAGESDEVTQKLDGLNHLLDGTVKLVRKISAELRPALLDDMGLIIAVQWHLKEFREHSGIRVVLNCSIEEPGLPDIAKTGLFRIVQESLTNVARHAGAKQVAITFHNEKEHLVLTIKDDGAGFNQQEIKAKKTLGLLGMKERTYMIGGTYTINGTPGEGTTVTVKVPLTYGESIK
jgi:signal transduction histidine kinase